MARTQIPITATPETGVAQPSATAGDAANDHYLDGDTDVFVECKNTSGAPLDVTFQTSYVTEGGLLLGENVITVAAGAIKVMKLKGNNTRLFYKQSADLDRIYVDVTSNSWEFRAYEI